MHENLRWFIYIIVASAFGKYESSTHILFGDIVLIRFWKNCRQLKLTDILNRQQHFLLFLLKGVPHTQQVNKDIVLHQRVSGDFS